MFLRLALVLALTGCALSPEGPEAADTAATQALSERQAEGVLALVNDVETDFELLDVDVALDRRAASNIIARRDGADAEAGTDDDRPFESIDELDAVSYVGPSALRRLEEYAADFGFVPTDDSPHGTYDGVAFTYGEADAVLAFINAASNEGLREGGVPSRAVTSILAARPVESMEVLASLYWVGPRTLETLRDSTRAGDIDCRTTADCEAGFRCEGRPYGLEFGKCRDTTNYPGFQEDCDVDSDCNTNLICIAASVYGQGYCADEWMRDSFESAVTQPLSASDAPMALPLIVYGQASVPEDFAINLDIEHSDPSSLWIALQPPTGQEPVVLWDQAAGEIPARFVDRSLYRDDSINGEYLLLVENRGGNGEGVLRSFGFDVSSRWD